MTETILQQLGELEKQHNISILYACESGSRAWGFASPDSDFDVRFIYSRKISDYLSIAEAKDVIDLPVNDLLDIGGWDIKKALKLFLKSNGPLYEWLQSPIVYSDLFGFADEMRRLMPTYFSLRSAANHYFSMAINTVNNDLNGEEAKIKRYFYALRSAMSCKWIIDKRSVPPMELGKLRVLLSDKLVQQHVNELLAVKSISDEKTMIKRVYILDNWLNETLEMCKVAIPQLPSNHQSTDGLNIMFRKFIANDLQ